MRQKGLGKGLEALFSVEVLNGTEEEGIKTIDINDIDPNSEQPRKDFSKQELAELSQSIKDYGILQPLVVRKKAGRYEIVAGERRYRAARMAQMTEVPVVIKDLSDQKASEISLIENVQRQDLNVVELAYAYSLLMEQFEYTQEEVAVKLGIARSSVTNVLRILSLSAYVQGKLRQNELTLGHAKVLSGIKDTKEQDDIADLIIQKGMNVRQTEKYVKEKILATLRAKKEPRAAETPFYRDIQDDLQKMFGTKVVISQGKKKGKIEIEYYNDDELERIIEMMKMNR